MRTICVASVAALVLAGPAAGQPHTPVNACVDTAVTTLKACLAKQYADTDRQLADAYKAALSRPDRSGMGRNLVMDWKRALQETQRKWIAYREADCGPPIAYESAKNPETRDVEQLRCKIGHTAERLRRLTATN